MTDQKAGGERPAMPLNEKASSDTSVKRDPHADNELIDSMQEEGAPSQGGVSGGNLQREIGARDEEKTAGGASPEPTQVNKSDKVAEGASPNPRDGTDLG